MKTINNKIKSKRFLKKKFHYFTGNSYDVRIKCITKKVKQLFKLKSKNPLPPCVIYEGVSTCQDSYIVETIRNVEIRWDKHEVRKDTEPAKHLESNSNHKILLNAPANDRIRKKFPASLIALNPLIANPIKWSTTLKQFVGKLPTNCLRVFDHFVGLALKGLIPYPSSLVFLM